MASNIYIGLCVTSHNDGTLCTAVIDNISYSAVNYESFSEAKAPVDTNTSLAVPIPTGTSAGDLLIAAVATDEDTSTTITTAAAGWTLINRGATSGAVTLGAWRKIAGASESSPTFTWTGGQQAYGWMMRFTGHNATNPINASSTGGETSSTPTSPAVTTAVGNCLILRLGAFNNDDINTLPQPGGNPGLSGHTAITADESASSGGGGGTVGILGSWASGLSHTKEAGTNRALIFIAHAESSNAISLSSVTYGGQTMTKVFEGATADGFAYAAAFILKETGVAAATSGTFVPTWSGTTPGGLGYSSIFLSNVNQTTPTGATANAASTTNKTITTSALATSSGDMVILAATCGDQGTYTINNGFTEGIDQLLSNGSATAETGHKAATGANETPSVTYVGQNFNRQVIIGLVVKGGGVTGTVCGGAGYVNQTIAGSSGTSNFSLTASDAAMMITIAIAPDSNTGRNACCDSQIAP